MNKSREENLTTTKHSLLFQSKDRLIIGNLQYNASYR